MLTTPTLKDWEEGFYESNWEPNTLDYSPSEKEWIEKVTSFLPRHMAPYDWNLPFAEMILLITRRMLIPSLLSQHQEEVRKKIEKLKRVEFAETNRYSEVQTENAYYNSAIKDILSLLKDIN